MRSGAAVQGAINEARNLPERGSGKWRALEGETFAISHRGLKAREKDVAGGRCHRAHGDPRDSPEAWGSLKRQRPRLRVGHTMRSAAMRSCFGGEGASTVRRGCRTSRQAKAPVWTELTTALLTNRRRRDGAQMMKGCGPPVLWVPGRFVKGKRGCVRAIRRGWRRCVWGRNG